MNDAVRVLRSLRGQLTLALLGLVLVLLALFAAYWTAEHRSHERVEQLSAQAVEELARDDLAEDAARFRHA
mgnify:CR=1 FL=1